MKVRCHQREHRNCFVHEVAPAVADKGAVKTADIAAAAAVVVVVAVVAVVKGVAGGRDTKTDPAAYGRY